MADASTTTATPWTPPAATASAVLKTPLLQRLPPAIGPVALFIVWDLVVRLGFIKPILLPAPADTVSSMTPSKAM